MSCLFVGGVADGEWYLVPDDRDVWVCAERPRLRVRDFDPNKPMVPSISRQSQYKRMLFRGREHTYSVFGEVSLTLDDVLLRFLENYRSQSDMRPEHE